MDNNKKIWIISAAIIVIAVVLFGIKYSQVENAYDENGVVFEQSPTEPAQSTAEISTEQIEAGAVEESEEFGTDEEFEPAEGADSTEPVEPVTADPIEPAEIESDPASSSETPTPATATPQVDNPVVENTNPPEEIPVVTAPAYRFRNEKLLNEHYEKHGIEMGFPNAAAYEAAASAVITNPNSLFKIEAEDGDGVYYLEATNEFVILSTDGYIRTYFLPSSGKAYFDRQ